jgi:acyl-CoA hydrolase
VVPTWSPQSDWDEKMQKGARDRIQQRNLIQREMRAQTYSSAGTAPRTVFRFLAKPTDVNWGGNAHGGIVMRWIEETAYACAASWSDLSATVVYAGGIHSHRPIHIGHLVEIEARLIYTERHLMHMSIRVRSAPPTVPRALELTTQSFMIYGAPKSDDTLCPVKMLPAHSEEDRRLSQHAERLIRLRAEMASSPIRRDSSEESCTEKPTGPKSQAMCAAGARPVYDGRSSD